MGVFSSPGFDVESCPAGHGERERSLSGCGQYVGSVLCASPGADGGERRGAGLTQRAGCGKNLLGRGSRVCTLGQLRWVLQEHPPLSLRSCTDTRS